MKMPPVVAISGNLPNVHGLAQGQHPSCDWIAFFQALALLFGNWLLHAGNDQ
jgi:hypothetical protein